MKEKENVLEGSAVEAPRAAGAVHAQSANESSLGLNSNVGMALVWLWWILALIFAIVEKRDKKVKVQAIQSLIFMGFFYVINMVLGIGFTIVSVVFGIIIDSSSTGIAESTGIVFFAGMCCYLGLIAILGLGIPVAGIIMGFTGRELKLPLIHKWASSLVARWA